MDTPRPSQKDTDQIIDPDLVFNNYSLSQRTKYSILNNTFEREIVNKNMCKYKFIVMINLNVFISFLHKYRSNKYYKYKNIGGDISENNINRAMVLSLMNTIAHYNHYIYKTFRSNVSFALYFPDPFSYRNHESFCNYLKNVCSFIPNVHFITDIPQLGLLSQSMLPSGLATMLSSNSERYKNKETKFLWIGPTLIDRSSAIYTNSYEIGFKKSPQIKDTNDYQIDEFNDKFYLDNLFESYNTNGIKELFHNEKMLEFWKGLSYPIKSILYVPIEGLRIRNVVMNIDLTDLEKQKIYRDTPKIILESSKRAIDNIIYSFSNEEALFNMERQEFKDFVFRTLVRKTHQSKELYDAYNKFCYMLDIRDRQDVIGSIKQFLPLWTKKLRDKSVSQSLSRLLNGNIEALMTEWLFEGVNYE